MSIVYTVEDKHSRLERWERTAILENGTIFIPASLLGNEKRLFLVSLSSGTPCICEDGHFYAPIEWLIGQAQDPEVKKELRTISDKIAAYARQEGDL